MIIPLALAVGLSLSAQCSSSSYVVTQTEQHVAFAGKLGNRVDLTLVIQVGDHTDTVTVGRQHTRFGKILDIKVGDLIKITDFTDRRSMKVMPDQIHVVRK